MGVILKQKKCRYCKEYFTPFNSLQPFCFKTECIQEHNKVIREKKARKVKKEFKESDKSTLLQLAQTVVNKYVRLRDSNKQKCISCDYKFVLGSRQIHGSHFRPAGQVQQLRFNTLNIWASCSICNNHKSGNLVPYRIALIEKFGLEWVEKLEANHETKKYTVEYLQRLIKVFRKKIKLYERKFRS